MTLSDINKTPTLHRARTRRSPAWSKFLAPCAPSRPMRSECPCKL